LIGAGLFASIYPKLEEAILKKGYFGELTLPHLLKINPWVVVVAVAFVLVTLLLWIEKAGL
jgi:hypothetical protein